MSENHNKNQTYSITVTPAAIARIKAQRIAKKDDSLNLRIAVQAGGCAGFEYKFALDGTQQDNDIIFADCIVIDGVSLSLLNGSEIDFVEELIGSDFKINNPNASMGCGCGISFSLNTDNLG